MSNKPDRGGAAMSSVNPFVFLDHTLNVLVVDNEPISREHVVDLLAPSGCYQTFTASSNQSALGLLQSGKRFHACIIELGIDDVDRDEFYLLRHYALHCSMLVLTRSTSPRSGADAVKLGARAVFDKGQSFDRDVFFRALNRLALINIVNHRWNEWSNDTLNIAVKLLFEINPTSVTAWAEQLKISDRQLRNLWHFNCGFGAKQVLFLYQCFRAAFDYYENHLSGGVATKHPATASATADRMSKYFDAHREVLSFMLS